MKLYNVYTYRTENLGGQNENEWKVYFNTVRRNATKDEVKAYYEKRKNGKKNNPNVKVYVFEADSENECEFIRKVNNNYDVAEKHNKALKNFKMKRFDRRMAEVEAMRKKGYKVNDVLAYIHK